MEYDDESWLRVRDPAYFERVLAGMLEHGGDGATGRFGVLGKGLRPNYQFERGDGRASPRRGDTHEVDARPSEGRYAESRLSPEAFGAEQVRSFLRRLLDLRAALLAAAPVALRLDAPLHDAYAAEAARLGRDLEGHVHAVLLERALALGLVTAPALAEKLALRTRLIDGAVAKAREVAAREGTLPDIVLRALRAAADDPRWRADYEAYVEADAFAGDAGLKTSINPRLDRRIGAALGLEPARDAHGRIERMTDVEGSVTKTATVFRPRDGDGGAAVPHGVRPARGFAWPDMPSIEDEIPPDLRRLFAGLARDLHAVRRADPDALMVGMPAYRRFVDGAYVCGFVCCDVHLAEAHGFYRMMMEDPAALRAARLDTLRCLVHVMMRAERLADLWNDEGTGGGVVEEAVRSGALAAIADGIEAGL